METPSPDRTWPVIKNFAIDAIDTSLLQLAQNEKGERLARNATTVPPPGEALKVLSNLKKRWSEQEYYAVPAEMYDGLPGSRYRLQFTSFRGAELTLQIPEETREALIGAPKVNVFCTSSIEIKLKKALRAALKVSPRGALVEQLAGSQRPKLSPWSPSYLPAGRSLNEQQQLALAAMTSPGASFIWGPPGTGKTSVITAAVRRALDENKSVLLSSHTHVAVDNVLEGLIAQSPDDASESFLKPGAVIRLASQQVQDKISPTVQEHPHLLYNKAAAVLTNHARETANLQLARRQNEESVSRENLRLLVDELAEVDLDEIHEAQQIIKLARQFDDKTGELKLHRKNEEVLSARLREMELQGEALDPPTSAVEADTLYQKQEAERLLAELEDGLLPLVRTMEELQQRRHVISDVVKDLEENLARGGVRLWFGQRRKLQEAVAREGAELSSVDTEIQKADAAWRSLQEKRQALTTRVRAAQQAWRNLEDTKKLLQDLAEKKTSATTALAGLRPSRLALETEIARIESAVRRMPSASEVLARASAEGINEKLAQLERLSLEVKVLDDDLEEIDRKRRRLDDEMAKTQIELLQRAPVVATTLATLTTNRQLLERRFDVVILDEVASAEAPYVVYAGSRADETLALVGDFLQNAPIADVADAKSEGERERIEWQRDDIFELFGIRDRITAEKHNRCVPLKRQYRYPSIIADLVNDFCYRGLLESQRQSLPGDGPTIRLIDTYSHPRKTLERDGNSWSSSLGLDILSQIVHTAPDIGDGSVGFVSPYRPQALRAQKLMRRNGVDVACGTSHAFQGREFDSVIFDLMQDGTTRWVGEADLNGSRRQVSAAKLLNVGITRAKGHLFLIGDWNFIQRSDMPGMRAISALKSRKNFQVIRAEDLVGPK